MNLKEVLSVRFFIKPALVAVDRTAIFAKMRFQSKLFAGLPLI